MVSARIPARICVLLLALTGCRDGILPDVPRRVDIVREAVHGTVPATPEQGVLSSSTAGTAAAEETWVGVKVRGPDGGPIGGMPIGWRMSRDEEWTLVGTSPSEPGRLEAFRVPVGAFVTVVGIPSEPGEIQVKQPSPVVSEGSPGVGAPPDAVAVASVPIYRFKVGATCTLGVDVRTADGAPVPGARFDRIPVRAHAIDGDPLAGETDVAGHAQLVANCTMMHLLVRPTDGPATLLPAIDPLNATGNLRVAVAETFVEVHGMVTDEHGRPVTGYHLRLWHTPTFWKGVDFAATPDAEDLPYARAVTGDDGQYSLKVAASSTTGWMLSRGHATNGGQVDILTLTPGTPKTRNITAAAGRWVEVRCEAATGTDCHPFGDPVCSGTDPEVKWAKEDDGGTSASPRIWCPVGEAVVYDDAVSVRIAPEESVARLDYRRMTGAVDVRVTRGGKPCMVTLRRPLTATLLGGVSSQRSGRRRDTRPFEHVPPGDWEVTSHCFSGSTFKLTDFLKADWSKSITVADTMVDLGTIELPPE